MVQRTEGARAAPRQLTAVAQQHFVAQIAGGARNNSVGVVVAIVAAYVVVVAAAGKVYGSPAELVRAQGYAGALLSGERRGGLLAQLSYESHHAGGPVGQLRADGSRLVRQSRRHSFFVQIARVPV